jgi:drug/metabolite transporter (DMT)-like permease
MSGRVAVLLAALLWSTSGLFIKSPELMALAPAERAGPLIALWRGVFCAILLLPFVRWRALRFQWALISLFFSFSLMSICFITAMTRSDAGDVIFLQYTAPFWVLLINHFWLREATPKRAIAALAVAMVGVVTIVGLGSGVGDLLGLCLALVAGVGYGGVIVSLRLLRDQDSMSVIALTQLVCVILLLPFVQGFDPWLQGAQWAWVGGLAVVQYAVPYVIFAWGLKHVGAQEASILTLLEPVLNPIWVLLIWSQAIASHTLIGGGLILIALIIRYTGASAGEEAPS